MEFAAEKLQELQNQFSIVRQLVQRLHQYLLLSGSHRTCQQESLHQFLFPTTVHLRVRMHKQLGRIPHEHWYQLFDHLQRRCS